MLLQCEEDAEVAGSSPHQDRSAQEFRACLNLTAPWVQELPRPPCWNASCTYLLVVSYSKPEGSRTSHVKAVPTVGALSLSPASPVAPGSGVNTILSSPRSGSENHGYWVMLTKSIDFFFFFNLNEPMQ